MSWTIGFANPDNDEEMYFYYVDGLTGKFVEAGYRMDRTIIKKEQLAMKGPDYSSSTVWMDQTNRLLLSKEHIGFCFPVNT